ncbi:similar to An09g04820 [Aspergillus luchuensis]|uniref:Similar to An09g04820 n=1 Tax=Aspergillus kawachii TaxID=1069201 RepID=A0A146FRX1_ASPKA|nr:similar to An09g04820 [Aspergillus luchuensis]
MSSGNSSQSPFDVPFDELPNPKQVWVGKPGSREEGLGKLAILTPEVVANAAATEIKTGRRVTMGWELTKLDYPNLNRQPCHHQIIPLLGGVAFDDVYTMNPQQSSQWDGLRHFSQTVEGQTERVFYGGATVEEINDRTNNRIGLQHWAKEGIADIKEIAKECGITFQKGDILFVRIGVTKEWDTAMTDDQKRQYSDNPSPEHAGVEATTDVLRWLWDTGFAAIASDAISWEVYPPQSPDLFLHEYVLAGWGMPIGELFDLEALSQVCQDLQRWSFFVASIPLNMPGGVSSPPNIMAIF